MCRKKALKGLSPPQPLEGTASHCLGQGGSIGVPTVSRTLRQVKSPAGLMCKRARLEMRSPLEGWGCHSRVGPGVMTPRTAAKKGGCIPRKPGEQAHTGVEREEENKFPEPKAGPGPGPRHVAGIRQL